MNGSEAIDGRPEGGLPDDRPTGLTSRAVPSPPSLGNVAIGIPLALAGRRRSVTWPGRLPERLAALWQSGCWNSPPNGSEPWSFAPADPAPPLWDGRTIVLTEEGKRGLGLVTAKVEAQTRPIQVEVVGTTKYDEDSLSRIRPMFKARVDKVWRTVGQTVKKATP